MMIPRYPAPISGVGPSVARQVDHVDHCQRGKRERAHRSRDHIRALHRLRLATIRHRSPPVLRTLRP